MLVDGRGCWLSRCEDRTIAPGTPALFLDRDDVLLADPGYLHRASQVELLEGATAVLRWANARAIPAIVVTNQSGIARGLFGWRDFHAVNHRMQELLAQVGASIDALIACAWHEDGQEPLRCSNHPWRKPEPGMLLAAVKAFGCKASASWMIGDRRSDMQAAQNAGLRGGIWITHDLGNAPFPPSSHAPSFEIVNAQSMTYVAGILSRKFEIEGNLRRTADAR